MKRARTAQKALSASERFMVADNALYEAYGSTENYDFTDPIVVEWIAAWRDLPNNWIKYSCLEQAGMLVLCPIYDNEDMEL